MAHLSIGHSYLESCPWMMFLKQKIDVTVGKMGTTFKEIKNEVTVSVIPFI